MENKDSIRNIIMKMNKNFAEWKVLEDFCRKNNRLDEFYEYKFDSYIKKTKKSTNIKTSSFFQNLGVTVFESVHITENKSIGISINPRRFQDLSDKSKEIEMIYFEKYKIEAPSILIHNSKNISCIEKVHLLDYCIKNDLVIEIINDSIILSKLK